LILRSTIRALRPARWALLLSLAAALLLPATSRAATAAEVAALKAAPCPAYEVLYAHTYEAARVAAAKSGDFEVVHGLPTAHLVPPIDWNADPYLSQTWRHYEHSLDWLDVLLYAYRTTGDLAALAQARDVALDWVKANPYGGASTPEGAWKDDVVGTRAGYLAYVTRAAACKGLLSDAQASDLLDSLEQHASYLADPKNHPEMNHGLFVDFGLGMLGVYLPFLPDAQGWVDLARQRYVKLLHDRVVEQEGAWTENTPAYQADITNLTDRFVQYVDPDPDLAALAERMHDATGWFVLPDGGLAPFGDANPLVIPSWVSNAGRGHAGLHSMPEAGYAMVKEPHSYLAVTSSFHNVTHKHADELSFELYDHGHRIVTDTGHYDYDPGPWHALELLAKAHSVLTVDDANFPVDRKHGLYYGSGIEATGQGSGWYGILATNPLLAPQGVSHRRLFLYKPGVALLVVDMVRSSGQHTYRRYFQLGPGVHKAQSELRRRVTLSASGFHGFLRSPGSLEAAKGAMDPVQGWSFTGYRVRQPRWTLDYRSAGAAANYLAEIGLRRAAPRAKLLWASVNGARIRLRGFHGKISVLRVFHRGQSLRVKVG
jgi:Heparinase II/III-like protein/Heparinase II/III N-terminus